MWKKLQYSVPFFMVYNKDSSSYNLTVTNYIKIWHCSYSRHVFLECLKDSNELLEGVEDEQLIQSASQMLSKPEEMKIFDITEHDNHILVVSMTRSSKTDPFFITVNLVEQSPNFFYRKITSPLLETIHDLKSSQEELRDLLKRKDKEIEEYKCEGGKIALKHLKTIPFNDEAHMSKHKLYEDNFEGQEIINYLLKTIQDEEKKKMDNLKDEPCEVKKEVSMKSELPETSTLEPQPIISADPIDNFKQEIVKTETAINNCTPRKKKKRFNY